VKAILDTSVLIATDLPPLEGELAISAATLAELHFGVLVTADPAVRAERLRRLSDLQRKFDALPVDDDVATSYGQLAAAVAATGRQPRSRVMDLLIAATAHAHSARLYTRNSGDRCRDRAAHRDRSRVTKVYRHGRLAGARACPPIRVTVPVDPSELKPRTGASYGTSSLAPEWALSPEDLCEWPPTLRCDARAVEGQAVGASPGGGPLTGR